MAEKHKHTSNFLSSNVVIKISRARQPRESHLQAVGKSTFHNLKISWMSNKPVANMAICPFIFYYPKIFNWWLMGNLSATAEPCKQPLSGTRHLTPALKSSFFLSLYPSVIVLKFLHLEFLVLWNQKKQVGSL